MSGSALEPIESWFASRGWEPFPFQREAWAAYLAGESGLLHAATGTGKTYAAALGPVAEWLVGNGKRDARDGNAEPLRLLWITPLRALAADTAEALRAPIEDLGIPWTVETRTGDTSPAVRARQRERLPSVLVTTPESISLILSWKHGERLLRRLRAVVVDEWHELMGSKRGVQTELVLSHLRGLRPELRTWGLSATLGNIETARDALLGVGRSGRLVRGLVPKEHRIEALVPERVDRFPWAGHLNTILLPRVVETVEAARTTLLFTNTRSQAEIWYRALLDARPDWAGILALHHGSLDRKTRDWVEEGLRAGRLKCVVATSSLDLGVDFTPVDQVLQVGSPKGVARLLQRAGRSGHQPGRESRVVCVPTHALELIEVAAAREAVARGAIEARLPVERPLDLLSQHLVTLAVGPGFVPEEALAEARETHAYRELPDDEWAWVLDFVTRGGPALRAYPEYARVVEREGRWVVEDPKIARRHRMSVGTIVSDAEIVVKYQGGGRIGTVEESFVARLKPGDTFVFGGRALEFIRVREMTCWVRRARSMRGAIPRWMGARMPLSSELAEAVRRTLDEARQGRFPGREMEAVRGLLELQAEWSRIPALDELLIERVKTREGHHLFFYPLEGRLVHEGLAALLAWRISRLRPISFTLAANDYGFELLAPDPTPLEEALAAGLLSPKELAHDIPASLNATEMARRQFREIARVAGLVFQGYPGQGKTARQLQSSSGLFYDVLTRHDPGNRLVEQAHREVLERQLERTRMGRTLERISRSRVVIEDPPRPTPLAFPLLVDRTREKVSSEKLADRIRRMQLRLEKAAG